MGEAKRRKEAGQMPPQGNWAPKELRIPGTFGTGTAWPGYPVGREVFTFDWKQNGCFALVGTRIQSADEVAILRRGRMKVGLLWKNDVVFMVLSWPDLMTVDMPFTAGLIPEALKPRWDECLATERTRLSITMPVVDAATGVCRGLRVFTVSPEFTRRLVAYARSQHPTTRQEHDLRVEDVYHRYPQATDMLADAEIVEVVGL